VRSTIPAKEGKALGLGRAEFDKIEVVSSGGLKSLEIMRDAGLPVAFGSYLLGEAQKVPLHGVRAPSQSADASRDHPLGHGGGRGAVSDGGADRDVYQRCGSTTSA